MAAAELVIGIELITPDKLALANQRDFWHDRADEVTEWWHNSRAQVDDLANRLAEQALINEELRARVDWYRNMYHAVGGDKIDDLIAEHRFNGVG